MNGELERFAYIEEYTLGWMTWDGLRLATIERPWIKNPKGKGGMHAESCVPEGVYQVRPHTSAKFPGTYVLVNPYLGVWEGAAPGGQTWGRSGILLHPGNTAKDVIGCIAVGEEHTGHGVGVILHSQAAMDHLRTALGRSLVHELTISSRAARD